MKKKILSIVLALAALSLVMTTGCSDDFFDEESTGTGSSKTEASADAGKLQSGVHMEIDSESGEFRITREEKKSTPMGEDGTWTVFVYLCGTDLESGGGNATLDLQQMLDAESNDNIRFVIQTGGTSQWANDSFATDACERWVIQNGKAECVASVDLSNMGKPETLSNFLKWGVENYPAAKMGVAFWDHGGGSITGACFDELNSGDSLSLAEINSALSEVYKDMTDQFEFIGFDCCLMGTAETANILASYARYFYGSQETEPGTGWDYTSIGNALAKNTSIDGAALGKALADSFYEECKKQQQENECTFTIMDLSKLDDFTIAFNDYAKKLYEAASSELADIVRGITSAENFGGNNKSEGYTNMVDIGSIIDNCSSYADGSSAISALKKSIVYNINGSDHKKASGLSIYYPLEVQGSEEIKVFSGICISPYYLSLVDMVTKGYSDTQYSNDSIIGEDGGWSNENIDESYFDNAEEGAAESKLITFAKEPGFDNNGMYTFTLDESGLSYTASVEAQIYLELDEETLVEIGETNDVNANWESGKFTDNFDGYWLSLPDEQPLPTYIVDVTDEYTVFTSPITLNGKETNLRVRVYNDYTTEIEGAWDGIDENGCASREIIPLKKGDKIAPNYYLYDSDEYFATEEYTWQSADTIDYAYLPTGDYYYSFCIDDVYGDYYVTDYKLFTIEDDGSISFSD